tara:strand:+ start:256 stop:498 length:243 start_codon:yes stop_codon:yes gene_type:complete
VGLKMAREGTITEVTAEEMERLRRRMGWLQSNMVDDLEIDNKIAHCREILDDIITYIASRDKVAKAEVSIAALKPFRKVR